jgi:hypothetical protein
VQSDDRHGRLFHDYEEPLTPEEIVRRFKKVLGRDMTPEERHQFFLPEDLPQSDLEQKD